MRRVFGPRTIVEAAVLVAVPVAALEAGAGWVGIVAASAVAYLLVFVLEAALARGELRPRRAPAAEPPEQAQTVVVSRPEPAAQQLPEPPVAVPEPRPEPAAAEPEPERVAEPEPEPEPVAAAEPVPEPEPVPVAAAEPEPVPIEQPPTVAVPEAPPAPAAPPEPEVRPIEHVRVLRPVPAPEPEPQPVAAVPEPAPAPAVVPIGVGAAPRQWNLWDLERLAREHTGDDAVRDEERTFLLMYLREFADPDGMLPVDFDGLVRDSFGDLLGAR